MQKIFREQIKDPLAAGICRRLFRPDRRQCLVVLGIAAAIFAAGCRDSLTGQNPDGPVMETPEVLTPFERDLKTMETADFQHIYVFRRKDGRPFEAEDKEFLRKNRPPEANRFVISDEDRAFIAGSNFPFTEENLKTLAGRFVIEDLSVPEQPAEKESGGEDGEPATGDRQSGNR